MRPLVFTKKGENKVTNKEIMWLRQHGKVGACVECQFRKPIDEMNTELLPCNQYQCLVKLAKFDESVQTQADDEAKYDKVKNVAAFNVISRQDLPVRIINKLASEEKIQATYVDKTFGTYYVFEFVGYELNEVADGRKSAGAEYVNYIFKCQCTRCGSIRYLTHTGLLRAAEKKGACRNCCRIPDDDERLIKWDK